MKFPDDVVLTSRAVDRADPAAKAIRQMGRDALAVALAAPIGQDPLGRIGEVRDVVGAIVFLASPAANLITGHTLQFDGGWVAC